MRQKEYRAFGVEYVNSLIESDLIKLKKKNIDYYIDRILADDELGDMIDNYLANQLGGY